MPELQGFDPEIISELTTRSCHTQDLTRYPSSGLIKKAFKSACRETNAVLAFLWIGVATSTLLMVYYLVLGTSKQKRVGRGVGCLVRRVRSIDVLNVAILQAWFQSLPRYDQPTSDPFADPAGNAQEFGVGVVSEDPDTK